MLLRDPGVRKLPVRLADSSVETGNSATSKNSAGDAATALNCSKPTSAGETGTTTVAGDAPANRGRCGSPVTPGPPKDYQPLQNPTTKKNPKASASSVAPAAPAAAIPSTVRNLALSSSASPSPSPEPVAPGPPPSRLQHQSEQPAGEIVGASEDEDEDSIGGGIVEASEDEDDHKTGVDEDEADLDIPTPAQRPKPRRISSEGASSRRIQPDRDIDFFLRRTVVKDIEKNPPPSPAVSRDGEDPNSSDPDYEAPGKKRITKAVNRVKTSASSSKNPDTTVGSGDAEADRNADDSEEDAASVVDLTGSSPSWAQRRARNSTSESPSKPATSAPSKTKVASTSKLPAKTQSKTTKRITGTKEKIIPRQSRGKEKASSTASGKDKAPSAASKGKGKATELSAKTSSPAKSPSPTKQGSTGISAPPLPSLTAKGKGITPEEALKRSRASWTKAHNEANARTTAESAGEPYEPPKNPASQYYLYFGEPYLKQDPNPLNDQVGIALDCRCCKDNPYTAWRPLDNASTSLLGSHVGTRRVQDNLAAAKISGPLIKYLVNTKKETASASEPDTEKLDEMQARQIAVAWITECARPITILADKWFLEWLTPDRRSVVPHRQTVSKDIGNTYNAMESVIRRRLASVEGAIHLALDIWTSANGHSFIGVVGCWHEEGVATRHVLDMITIMERHTAQNVARAVTDLMKRLQIEEKVWFIASDSASTNTAMMKILGKDKRLTRIEGEGTQIRCMAHVLNLISEAIIRPFNKAVRDTKEGGEVDLPTFDEEECSSDHEPIAEDSDDDADVEDGALIEEEDEPDFQDDRAFSASLHPSEYDTEDDALIRRALTAKSVAYVPADPQAPSISTDPPAPSQELRAESGEIGLQIRQLAFFARKIRYNTRLRRSFQKTCALFNLPTPHSLIRDVATRWNSTFAMIERALVLWDAITAWQEHNSKLIPAKFRIKRAHKVSLKMLIKLLEPLKNATLAFSMKTKPTIADVVGTYEELDEHYRAIEDDEDLRDTWREAAKRASAVYATYYGLADDTKIYYLAVILHPNLRIDGMRSMCWEDEWIRKAENTLRTVFDDRYRRDDLEQESRSQSQDPDDQTKRTEKPKSRLLQRLQAAQQAAQPAPDPIAEWVAGSLSLVKGKMVNPLEWWWKQHRMGVRWGGLTDLALDVFSAPATSVDVERLFSKAGHHITPLRHRLKAVKLGQMVWLGAWFKEDWVPQDCLRGYLYKQKQRKLVQKANANRRASEESAGPSKRVRADAGETEG
ncbi:unnamed protein product [Tilletia controversa]|nr:unnamed protein product [Tilletia controversa]